MGKSFIGLNYKPFDNSYAFNVTKSIKNSRIENDLLAGTTNKSCSICKIVSEPFICKIESYYTTERLMIMVSFNDQTHCVLFREENVIENVMLNGIPNDWGLYGEF